MRRIEEVKHIVIHCSATPNGDSRFRLEDLDRMHRDRGWFKIGYHYVIEVEGRVRVGRYEDEEGAHVKGNNRTSLGICMIGTDKFTIEQWRQLASLVSTLQLHYPGAKVVGHRDFSPDLNGDGHIDKDEWIKECPGFDVAHWLTSMTWEDPYVTPVTR